MKDLEGIAKGIRQDILSMIVSANKGHIGGSLSVADILVALYFGGILNYRTDDPMWTDRDRLIFSKGHACEALYATLAQAGFFHKDMLLSYCKDGTGFGGHADAAVPGVDVSTGSLGHGLGVGTGIALGAALDNKSFKTIVVLGDGECYEGSVWEAASFAGHHQLENLIAIVDRNQQITLNYTEECNRLEPFADKWKAFGWEVNVINGHSFKDILNCFELERLTYREKPSPLVVIANTTKGKGISFMENSIGWHHTVPKGEQLEIAKKDLGF